MSMEQEEFDPVFMEQEEFDPVFMEHGEFDPGYILRHTLRLPPDDDTTFMSEDSCGNDTEDFLPRPTDMSVVPPSEEDSSMTPSSQDSSMTPSSQDSSMTASSQESSSSAELDLGPPILSALEIEFAEGPPGFEAATTLPIKCFFPPDVEDASYPYPYACGGKETEPEGQKSIKFAIDAFKKVTMYENFYRPRDDPGPILQEFGLDFGSREVGQHFVILDLLSWPHAKGDAPLVRIGSRVQNVTVEEALRPKTYILICCVFVPFLNYHAHHVRGISSATLELKKLYPDDVFETVIVAHMIPGWKDDEAAFNRFLTAFPGCLALPFEDGKRRDFVCTVLNHRNVPLRATSVLVRVDNVAHVVILDDDVTSYFGNWGANIYPFTRERVEELNSKLFNPQSSFSLEYILGCKSSDSFSRLSGEEVQVSHFRDRHVGLYLYAGGDSIKTVFDAHQRFKHKGFEVLIFPNPCYNEDPVLFEQFVRRSVVDSRLKVSDWVFVPYKDSAARRLRLRFPQEKDCLLMLDPKEMVVDPHALDVIKAFGPHSFPFNNDLIIRDKVRKFRDLKLQSLFSNSPLYRGNDPGNKYSTDGLGSGIVFVFFSVVEGGVKYLEGLRDSLEELRIDGPQFEVLVVLWAPTTSFSKHTLSILSDRSWLVCPVDNKGKPPAVVADLASDKICFPELGFLSFLDGELCSIACSGVASVLEQHPRDVRDEMVRLEVIQCYVDSGLGLEFMKRKPFALELNA